MMNVLKLYTISHFVWKKIQKNLLRLLQTNKQLIWSRFSSVSEIQLSINDGQQLKILICGPIFDEATWILSHRSSEEDSIRSNDGEFDQTLIFQISRFWFIVFGYFETFSMQILHSERFLCDIFDNFDHSWKFLTRYEIKIVGFTWLCYTLKKFLSFRTKF